MIAKQDGDKPGRFASRACPRSGTTVALVAVRSSRCLPAVWLLVGALALAGCSKAATKDPAKESASSSPSTISSSSSASAASVTPSAKPSVPVPASLGGRCDDLLPVSTVDIALGRPVIGKTAFVLGVAEPNIGRLTYLNCRYGVQAPARGKPAPAPLVEIGISLYKSVQQAAVRVQGTIEDYRSHGATQTATVVDQFPGTVLLGYGSPTLVAAAGPRTVAVTIDAKLASGAPAKALAALAKAALDATARFTGVSVASPSATS